MYKLIIKLLVEKESKKKKVKNETTLNTGEITCYALKESYIFLVFLQSINMFCMYMVLNNHDSGDSQKTAGLHAHSWLKHVLQCEGI